MISLTHAPSSSAAGTTLRAVTDDAVPPRVLTQTAVVTASAVFGFVLVLSMLSVLAPKTHKQESVSGPRQISMTPVVKPPPPPPKAKPERKTRARKAKASAAASAPRLANALGGLDFGLPAAFRSDSALNVDKSLLGETEDVVMTESTVDELPRPVSRPAPQMPARARREGIEGRVVLRLSIDKSGAVTAATVIESSHPTLFDETAIAAAKRWRYAPARYRGQPVAIWALQPIDFKLEGSR